MWAPYGAQTLQECATPGRRVTDAQARCLGDASCAPLVARVAELRRKEATGWWRSTGIAPSLPTLPL